MLPRVGEATLGRLDPVVVAILDIPLFVLASGAAALGFRVAATVATAWTWLVAAAMAVYATVTGAAGWGALLMAAAAMGSLVALFLVRIGRVPVERLLWGPFAFHPAAPLARAAAHVALTAAQTLCFWGLFLGLAPLAISALERRWDLHIAFAPPAATAGAAILVVASGLGLWSAWSIATRGGGTPLPSAMPNRLVVAGPYRFVRNPMAVAGILQGAAVGLLLSSWLVIVYAVSGAALWHLFIRPLEEADLETRFGEPYRRYRHAVRCWWPRLGGPTGAG